MSKVAELRAKLTAMVQAMPLPAQIEALDKLDSKRDKDESEMRVQVEIAMDLRKRLMDMAREHETDALMLDLIDMMKLDPVTRPYSKQMTFQAIGDVLEERFPAAREAAEEWLDTVNLEECAADGYDYHRYLLAMVEIERAGK